MLNSLLHIPDQPKGREINTRYGDNVQLIRTMEGTGLMEYLMTAISSLSTTTQSEDREDSDDEE